MAPPSPRVLFVGTLPPHPGGTAVSAFQLLGALADLGHPVTTLAPVTRGSASQARRFDAAHPALRVTRYSVERFDIGEADADHARRERRALMAHLPRLVRAHRPAVVLAGRESFGWNVPGIAARAGVPSILLLRGGAPTARLLSGSEPAARVREAVRRFQLARRRVAVAQHLATGFARLGLSPVEILPNFVDLGRFTPGPPDPRLLAALQIPPGSIVVAFVANLKTRKRPLDLVAAAALAVRRDPRLVYLVVGDGPLRGAMVRACAAARLTDRFRFAGWVDYGAIPAHLRLADIVVLPSEAEGMARVYLEAQACGRLLVASAIPPAQEVVRHGETGLLFRLGDVEDLAAQILAAAADPALRTRLGAGGRERVRAHDLGAVVRAYSTLIHDVAREGLVAAPTAGGTGAPT